MDRHNGNKTMDDRRDPRIDELRGEFGVLNERVEALTVTMDRVYSAVSGNGKPGLGERVSLLEQRAKMADYWGTIVFRALIPIAMFFMGGGVLWYMKQHL